MINLSSAMPADNQVLKVPGHQQVKCRQCKINTELI